MARETHQTRLLEYLKKYEHITSLEAIRDLGNTRLSATIFNLKEEGHIIESESTTVPTRWGTTTTVAKYTYKTKLEDGNQMSINDIIDKVKW